MQRWPVVSLIGRAVMTQFRRVETDQTQPAAIGHTHGIAVIHACDSSIGIDAICPTRMHRRGNK